MDWFLGVMQGLGGWVYLFGTSATVQSYATEIFKLEMFKMTVCFMLAAAAHRRWVKKDMEENRQRTKIDMKEQVAKITSAIDNVAQKLTEGLESHNRRIGALEQSMLLQKGTQEKLVARIEKIEQVQQTK